MRGLLLVLLAGCASTPAPLEARTTEPAAPSYRSHAPANPRRTRLAIPAEYVDQLEWDPAAFEDVPVMFEAQEPPEPSLPARFRSPRARTTRARAQRPFRTTGVRVSLAGASGHPMGRGGHPVARSAHPVGASAQPVGKPGQAVKVPGQAVSKPGQAVKQPGQAVGRPGQAVRRPGNPVERPSQAVKRPGHAVKKPGQAVKQPGQPIDPVPPSGSDR